MPTITQHAPGSFCWVELATTDPAAANRSYATSHLAVQYIIDTWGVGAITQLIQQFRDSATADQALSNGIGLDTEGLDAQFRDWLEQQS